MISGLTRGHVACRRSLLKPDSSAESAWERNAGPFNNPEVDRINKFMQPQHGFTWAARPSPEMSSVARLLAESFDHRAGASPYEGWGKNVMIAE